MPGTTTNQGVPYALPADKLSTTPATTLAMAQFLEKRGIMIFADATERNSKATPVANGMVCYVQNVHQLQARINGAWRVIYPPTPAISSGTANPSGTANAGDIYIKY